MKWITSVPENVPEPVAVGSKHVRPERVSLKWSTVVPSVSSALARGVSVRLAKNRTVMPRTTLLDFKYRCGSPIHTFFIVKPYRLISSPEKTREKWCGGFSNFFERLVRKYFDRATLFIV